MLCEAGHVAGVTRTGRCLTSTLALIIFDSGIELYNLHKFQIHRILHLTSSEPPNQKGCKAFGKSRPIILSPSNCTPFSKRAIINRGMAAAVPFSVCAKGKDCFSDELGDAAACACTCDRLDGERLETCG